MIEGKRPAPKSGGTYVDERGYVQELAPGEKRPESTGTLKDWLRSCDVENDPELQAALGPELFFEEMNGTDLFLIGRLENTGWRVSAKAQDGTRFKFRLSRGLSKQEAIEQAGSYTKSQLGPVFKTLTENEMRMCERMSINNRNEALVFYIAARLPDALADRFLQLGNKGDELSILHFAADEKISEIAEEAVAYCFYWNNTRANDAFFTWVKANDDGRMWTFALLDTLWEQYQQGAIGVQNQPSQKDVEREAESMSDAELASVIAEARKLQRQSR